MVNLKIVYSLLLFLWVISVNAQKKDAHDQILDKHANTALDSLSRKAADPTAIMWQVQLEDYWVPEVFNSDDSRNSIRIRAVVPIVLSKENKCNQLVRVTINRKNYSNINGGWSDFEIFDLIIPRKYKWGTWGLGPLVSMPTATQPEYGSGKWSIGTAIAASINNPNIGPWQLDILIEYLTSIAGEEDRNDVNQIYLQPSLTYHLSDGFYLETEPVWLYSFEEKTWSLPMNIRAGKVWITNRLKFNTYIEPEFMMYSNQNQYPEWGIRFGLRLILEE